MNSMKNDIFIDVSVRHVDNAVSIEFSQNNFSFSMNVGRLLKVIVEDKNLLLLQFEKGDIRIEISLEELKINKFDEKF
jgi:hypothetical protein